jgi:DNA-binding LacI/PurR family transcriptional regulator
MGKRLNIKTFSAQAGYSVATVSRALNPQTAAMVKSTTREKIQELAAALDFVPHPGARVLRRSRPAPIAVLLREKKELFLSEYYSQLLMGIMHESSKLGQVVHAMAFKPSETNLREQLNEMTVGCCGIIYLSDPLTEAMLLDLGHLHRPFVSTTDNLLIDAKGEILKMPVFGLDEFAGGRLVTQHLIDLGHRNIAYLGGPERSHDSWMRRQGFESALHDAGLSLRPEWYLEGTFDFECGAAAVPRVHAMIGEVTAIVCSCDEQALGLLRELSLRGVRCPEDISVTGYDDLQWASRFTPALTTVRQPLVEMAATAVQMVNEPKLRVDALGPQANRLFIPELVVRGSTARVGV